jgi:endonuclease III
VNRQDVVDALLAEHGRTFAEDVDIDLSADDSESVFCLLVASILFSSRIGHELATSAARALFAEGWTSPRALADAGWRARTDVLNASGYARYDESTSRMLEDTCHIVLDRYDGDLLRLREQADGDPEELTARLTDFKGIGAVGAEIFLREIQAAWPEFAPFVDERAADAAEELDLPRSADALSDLAGDDFPRLVAALVRTAIGGDVDRIRRLAAGDEAPSIDPDRTTRDELYDRAAELDVSGRSSMNKSELAEAVERERSADSD